MNQGWLDINKLQTNFHLIISKLSLIMSKYYSHFEAIRRRNSLKKPWVMEVSISFA